MFLCWTPSTLIMVDLKKLISLIVNLLFSWIKIFSIYFLKLLIYVLKYMKSLILKTIVFLEPYFEILGTYLPFLFLFFSIYFIIYKMLTDSAFFEIPDENNPPHFKAHIDTINTTEKRIVVSKKNGFLRLRTLNRIRLKKLIYFAAGLWVLLACWHGLALSYEFVPDTEGIHYTFLQNYKQVMVYNPDGTVNGWNIQDDTIDYGIPFGLRPDECVTVFTDYFFYAFFLLLSLSWVIDRSLSLEEDCVAPNPFKVFKTFT